jgi:hypothetical protein
MNETATIDESLFMDRGLKKVRVNLVRGNRISGFIKPI